MADSVPHRTPPTPSPETAELFTPAYLERRRRALEQAGWPTNLDEFDSKAPSGHAKAIRTSVRLTSYTKRYQRKASMDITPQEVIDTLNAAGVKKWVLMGLHGYVGYLPEPRATQDVDVMVPYSQRKRAAKAISARWPELAMQELPQVTRFLDPLDLDFQGKPKPAVDLMHPWSPFQELIIKEYVVVDEETQHRLPTLEAALASKYAAMISPYRERRKKELDMADFRGLVQANRNHIQMEDLRRIAGQIWENGGDEIEQFVKIALTEEPFPI